MKNCINCSQPFKTNVSENEKFCEWECYHAFSIRHSKTPAKYFFCKRGDDYE